MMLIQLATNNCGFLCNNVIVILLLCLVFRDRLVRGSVAQDEIQAQRTSSCRTRNHTGQQLFQDSSGDSTSSQVGCESLINHAAFDPAEYVQKFQDADEGDDLEAKESVSRSSHQPMSDKSRAARRQSSSSRTKSRKTEKIQDVSKSNGAVGEKGTVNNRLFQFMNQQLPKRLSFSSFLPGNAKGAKLLHGSSNASSGNGSSTTGASSSQLNQSQTAHSQKTNRDKIKASHQAYEYEANDLLRLPRDQDEAALPAFNHFDPFLPSSSSVVGHPISQPFSSPFNSVAERFLFPPPVHVPATMPHQHPEAMRAHLLNLDSLAQQQGSHNALNDYERIRFHREPQSGGDPQVPLFIASSALRPHDHYGRQHQQHQAQANKTMQTNAAILQAAAQLAVAQQQAKQQQAPVVTSATSAAAAAVSALGSAAAAALLSERAKSLLGQLGASPNSNNNSHQTTTATTTAAQQSPSQQETVSSQAQRSSHPNSQQVNVRINRHAPPTNASVAALSQNLAGMLKSAADAWAAQNSASNVAGQYPVSSMAGEEMLPVEHENPLVHGRGPGLHYGPHSVNQNDNSLAGAELPDGATMEQPDLVPFNGQMGGASSLDDPEQRGHNFRPVNSMLGTKSNFQQYRLFNGVDNPVSSSRTMLMPSGAGMHTYGAPFRPSSYANDRPGSHQNPNLPDDFVLPQDYVINQYRNTATTERYNEESAPDSRPSRNHEKHRHHETSHYPDSINAIKQQAERAPKTSSRLSSGETKNVKQAKRDQIIEQLIKELMGKKEPQNKWKNHQDSTAASEHEDDHDDDDSVNKVGDEGARGEAKSRKKAYSEPDSEDRPDPSEHQDDSQEAGQKRQTEDDSDESSETEAEKMQMLRKKLLARLRNRHKANGQSSSKDSSSFSNDSIKIPLHTLLLAALDRRNSNAADKRLQSGGTSLETNNREADEQNNDQLLASRGDHQPEGNFNSPPADGSSIYHSSMSDHSQASGAAPKQLFSQIGAPETLSPTGMFLMDNLAHFDGLNQQKLVDSSAKVHQIGNYSFGDSRGISDDNNEAITSDPTARDKNPFVLLAQHLYSAVSPTTTSSTTTSTTSTTTTSTTTSTTTTTTTTPAPSVGSGNGPSSQHRDRAELVSPSGSDYFDPPREPPMTKYRFRKRQPESRPSRRPAVGQAFDRDSDGQYETGTRYEPEEEDAGDENSDTNGRPSGTGSQSPNWRRLAFKSRRIFQKGNGENIQNGHEPAHDSPRYSHRDSQPKQYSDRARGETDERRSRDTRVDENTGEEDEPPEENDKRQSDKPAERLVSKIFGSRFRGRKQVDSAEKHNGSNMISEQDEQQTDRVGQRGADYEDQVEPNDRQSDDEGHQESTYESRIEMPQSRTL